MKMASNIKQSVLITGCSKGGIGDALAQEFLSRGFVVFATARNLGKIQHLKTLGCEILPLDVTDEKSINEAVEAVSGKTGGELHYLINNAGMRTFRPPPAHIQVPPHLGLVPLERSVSSLY
jgi:1-acylglycerone phosphate reductase